MNHFSVTHKFNEILYMQNNISLFLYSLKTFSELDVSCCKNRAWWDCLASPGLHLSLVLSKHLDPIIMNEQKTDVKSISGYGQ
jgi:hypothetical protein